MRSSTARPGRDRRAERHPAPRGLARVPDRRRVTVVGGGIAGMAAAVALAERGVEVTLLEREHQLGGRVRAWPVSQGGDDVTMSRGFHAFFRQYYNLRALLRRADPMLQRLVPLADYPLLSSDGARESFAKLPRTPPWNLVAFLIQSEGVGLRDVKRVNVPAARELLAVEFPRSFESHQHESAAQFLDRLRFPDHMRHLALHVFSRSFFANPEDFSAGELIGMFHSYFVGSAEGLLFDVPDDDFDTALWRPLGRVLADLGVDVRLGAPVHGLDATGAGVRVTTDDGEVDADAVVVATDLVTTQRLVAGADGLAPGPDGRSWRARLAALRTAPPFAVWRVWLDRRADERRAGFLGTAGFGCVDNISLLERYERGAADWSARHGGSVAEVHAYALSEGSSREQVQREMRQAVDAVYPELAGAAVLGEEYLERADCPLVGVEPWAQRPGVVSPDRRLVLAGDGVRCDYPVALMERAATTGFQAANELLSGWGVTGHDLWTVPTRSRFRLAPDEARGA